MTEMPFVNCGTVCNSVNPFLLRTNIFASYFQVSVDVFKGFPDEDSIVNYTLNQAYQDNVSVFASELFLCTFNALQKYLYPCSYSHFVTPYQKTSYLIGILCDDLNKVE